MTKEDQHIANKIHYPKCWDTIAYPTLASALWEMVHINPGSCPVCKKALQLGADQDANI